MSSGPPSRGRVLLAAALLAAASFAATASPAEEAEHGTPQAAAEPARHAEAVPSHDEPAPPAAEPAADAPLAPWQMVRSLQTVQDRIADGDGAALPMQRRLLAMIDARLRAASAAELAEPRNFDAVLVYAMGGGNPRTLQALMPDLMEAADALSRKPDAAVGEEGKDDGEAAPQEDAAHGEAASGGEHGGEGKKEGKDKKAKPAPPLPEEKRLALGVFNYGRSQLDYAREALAGVDPMREPPELGAFLALIKGSLAAGMNPAGALASFDQARLLAPGTLVEEAALRRSVALAVGLEDPARFRIASGQYVRRFLRSPYASQFADAFVTGIVALHGKLDLVAAAGITADMEPEQERVVWLRVARRAAIENLSDLSEFASARAGAVREQRPEADPRAALYAALPRIASPDTFGILVKLNAIDPTGLTAGDRELLAAAKAVAGETLAKPAPVPLPEAADAPPALAIASAAPAEEHAPDAEAPAEMPAGEKEPAHTAAPQQAEAAPPADAAAAAAEAKVAEVRRALDDVDRLLSRATE